MKEMMFQGKILATNEFGGDGIYAAWKLSYQKTLWLKKPIKELRLIIIKNLMQWNMSRS